jgi:hypothetical protein
MRLVVSFFLAFLFLTVPLGAVAQSPQASISGVVTDAQGGIIPGVEVAATELGTGVKTATRTNESGFYSLRPLPIGAYLVVAQHAGFRPHERKGITLTTGQALELNITMEVGTVSEKVVVTSEAPLLETRNSEASQLIDSKTIEDMPLGDRRAMNLIEITGGAVFVDYDTASKPNFSLAGGRTQSQGFMIDGGTAQNMRLGVGQVDTDPPIETLQEVKVLMNAFSAEFGGSAGGVIITTTKSGTNRMRGSVSEYLRNQAFDAPNFFAPIADAKKQKPALRYNVFGGTLGGPIRRDKTFYFFSYEGSRRRDGSVRTLTVPTALQRSGDFSQTFTNRGVLIPIYDPGTGRTEGTRTVRDPFPGNRIPANRFDPIGAKLLTFYPLPNRAPDDPTGANNFRGNDITKLTRDNYLVKVDHNLSDKDKFTARYLYNSDDAGVNSVYANPSADTTNDQKRHQQFWYGSWTRILTPTVINELRINYGNRINHAHSKGLGENWASKLGLKGVLDDAFPNFQPAGYTNLGSTAQDRRQFPITQHQFVNNTSWVRAKHTVKFGAEVRLSHNVEVNRTLISGQFIINRPLTGQQNSSNTGDGAAGLLLGLLSTYNQRGTPMLNRHSWYLSGFWQDDWTVHRGLTLNIGLRWETDTPMADANDRFNMFDTKAINPVSGTPGVVKFAGVNGWRKQAWNTDWNNFGPRFGFAWRPFGLQRTVVRGGFGVFYAHPFDRGSPTAASLGFENSTSIVTTGNEVSLPYSLSGGVPPTPTDKVTLDDSFGAVTLSQTTTTSVTFFETTRRAGYAVQYNLQIQRELRGQTLVELGYLANLSRKLPSTDLSLNQIPPQLLGPGVGRAQRPFPQFSGVSVANPTLGVSNYNAGVAKLQKRFSRGMNILATYTFAKFLDNCASMGGGVLGDENNPYSNFYDRRMDYGPAENDIRHRITWSSSYQLPFGRGRAFLAQHPLRHVVGNWSLGTVVTWQSGPPITVRTQTNTTQANAAGAQRADVIRDPNLPSDQRTIYRWFDTDAFLQPATYQFGNQGVGLVRAPGRATFNCSFIRNFNVREGKQLQFRGELFNIVNHPNFALPAHIFEGPGFGIISAARAARQIQFGLRLTF